MASDYKISINVDSFRKELESHLQTASSVFVLCDSNTLQHCWPKIADFNGLKNAEIIEIPPGEEHKDLEIIQQVWAGLLEMGADRKSILINLGGGVITDMGGFVASTFKRGIRYINIPTSLLAIVDASIGGKTGINLNSSKNQIGTFSEPDKLFLNTDFLETLPERELISGYAEMLKHGIIADEQYWKDLSNIEFITEENISNFIAKSIEIKVSIVEQDPKESGIRKTLNFGHTVGHAFESISQKWEEPLLHGEAIALGMIVELLLSVDLLDLDPIIYLEINNYLREIYPIQQIRNFKTDELWKELLHDKKNENGIVLMVLLQSIGQPKIDIPIGQISFAKAMKLANK